MAIVMLKIHPLKIPAALVGIFGSIVCLVGSCLIDTCFIDSDLISQNLSAIAQPNPTNSALTIRADTQEANSKTGVVTAKGNVLMNYPARAIVATSTQAQYFSKERRIILTGNVVVTQQGNKIVAETITYLIDEGKFEAKPESNRQVESTYIVPDESATTTTVKQLKPAFKSPVAPSKTP
jgi:lipopolysaccharide export system protein LptA